MSKSLNAKVKYWYTQTYPDDSLGKNINEDLTFEQLKEAVFHNIDVYDTIGVGDSLIRERCFESLADRMGISYGELYDGFMESTSIASKSGQEL